MSGTNPYGQSNGWSWYCDVHDTQGSADSREEAEHVARARGEFLGEECAVLVQHWRNGESTFDWDFLDPDDA